MSAQQNTEQIKQLRTKRKHGYKILAITFILAISIMTILTHINISTESASWLILLIACIALFCIVWSGAKIILSTVNIMHLYDELADAKGEKQ